VIGEAVNHRFWFNAAQQLICTGTPIQEFPWPKSPTSIL
jgi:hypothetical protein